MLLLIWNSCHQTHSPVREMECMCKPEWNLLIPHLSDTEKKIAGAFEMDRRVWVDAEMKGQYR